jgi:hypothetical protein
MHKLYDGKSHIQFNEPDKAKQTFANFSFNIYPNLTKNQTVWSLGNGY